jgi:hypothetical protein
MDNKKPGKLGSEYRKVIVPPYLLKILRQVAEGMQLTEKQCLNMLLDRIDNIASTDPKQLGFEFERARKQLEGRGEFTDGDAYAIDTARLHRSDKTKSGYTGIYVNGKGFVAHARASLSDRTEITLGTFPSATQAAEVRRIHYVKHGIPYGRLGEKIESYRNRPEGTMSPEFQRQVAIHDLAKEGTPAEGLSEEERVWETQDPYDHHPLSIKQVAK